MSAPLAPVLVDCEPRSMRLTSTACVKLWRSSNPEAPPAWEGRASCHTCPVGALRAGVVLDPMAGLRKTLTPICPRCARVANRMVARRLCISCYNREAELVRGRNARGRFPVLVAQAIGPTHFSVAIAGGFRVISMVSSGAAEIAIRELRKAAAPIFVGVAPFDIQEAIAA